MVPATGFPMIKLVCDNFFRKYPNNGVLAYKKCVPCFGSEECLYMVSQHLDVVAFIVALMPLLVTPLGSIM